MNHLTDPQHCLGTGKRGRGFTSPECQHNPGHCWEHSLLLASSTSLRLRNWCCIPNSADFCFLPGDGHSRHIPGAAAADSRANKESFFFFLKYPTVLHLGRFSLCSEEIWGKKSKKKGEPAWPLIFFLPAFYSYWKFRFFSPACKVKLHSDERDKEQQIYVKQL